MKKTERGHQGVKLTLVQALPSLFPDNSSKRIDHILLRAICSSDVHPALDSDVWVRNTCCCQFSEGAENKNIPRQDPPPFRQRRLQLLKNGVLQDRIYHQH